MCELPSTGNRKRRGTEGQDLTEKKRYYLRVAVSSDVFVCFVKKIYATCKVERCHEIDFTIVYNFSGKNELGCSSAEEVARSVIS